MNTRTQRRPASARHRQDDHGAFPSLLETVIDFLTDRIARSALLRVDRGVHQVVRWTLARVILVGVGAAVMTGGSCFCLQPA